MTDPNYAALFERASSRIMTGWGQATYARKPSLAAAVSARRADQLRPFYPPGAVAAVVPAPPRDALVGGQVPQGLQRDDPDEWFERDEVWVEYPDRSRVEGLDPGGRYWLNVVSLHAWATRDPDGRMRRGVRPTDPRARAIEREVAHRHHEVALALLQPRWLLHGYTLLPHGETEVAGRRAVRVDGRPTYDARSIYASGGDEGPNVLEGADKVEFSIDAELGVVLRWAGIASDEEYEATTFTAIAFNERMDDQLFDPTSARLGRAGELTYP